MSTDDELNWDPIEDVVENDRNNYLDLIKRLLWIADIPSEISSTEETTKSQEMESQDGPAASSEEASKKKKKKVKSKAVALVTNTEDDSGSSKGKLPPGARCSINETSQQMRERLRRGMGYIPAGITLARGVHDGNVTQEKSTASMQAEEIDELEREVAEIRMLLFCRIVLSHPKLLPLALRTESVEGLLSSEDITTSDLRDICLRLEQPTLQEIRDACADLVRSDDDDVIANEISDIENTEHTEITRIERQPKSILRSNKKERPTKWSSEREKALLGRTGMPSMSQGEAEDRQGKLVDFGPVEEDEGPASTIRVKVCGKTIFRYASEKSMASGGWFQFSVIAKDSSLYDAVQLCRHWNEFWELNVLAIWGYLPNVHWPKWAGDRWRTQFLQVGFIPYQEFYDAQKFTNMETSGGRAGGKMHNFLQLRNFVCAHIKRDDPASRRLIQYLSMEPLLMIARNPKTGKILFQPREEDCWFVRSKSGKGRHTRNEWVVDKKINVEFFEWMDKGRPWYFGFTDYYDLIIWDYYAGVNRERFFATINEVSRIWPRYNPLEDCTLIVDRLSSKPIVCALNAILPNLPMPF